MKKYMSKKKTLTSFSKLSDALDKIAPDGAIIDDSVIAKIDEWIPTGSYILNACISGSLFGGMPNRRSIALAGMSGCGKSYLALSMCRMAQTMGYDIIYFDSEGAIDREFVSRLGVDTSRFRLQPVNTIEQVNFITAKIVDSYKTMSENQEDLPKVMVVLDSLGNLSSEKEVNDSNEGSDKRDMTKQQAIRKLFRVNGMQFARYGIPFVITAHQYASIGAYVPTNIVSGGGGILYNASIVLEMTPKKLEDKEAEQNNKNKNIEAVKVGITVTIKPIKQRFARPIKVELHIPLYKKPNPYVGLEKFISWDTCGILRGKLLSQKEYDKLDEPEKKRCKSFEIDKGMAYALPKDTARTLVCRHLKSEVPIAELFTSKVITDDVLKQLDENIIKPTFQLPDINSLDDLSEIADDMDENSVPEQVVEI